ncbi:MAG: FAD-dependent oxidoreductase [Xanthobacteraceae bacterium]|nr:FAD-dependent oxidoreductase [Xanthobacteraceae bacterium]
MGKHAQQRRAAEGSARAGSIKIDLDRRSFLTTGAAGAVAAGLGASESAAQGAMRWDMTADVVVIGAGVAGLPAAIAARDAGASVIVVEENFDIGGRGMLSGGRVQLGGGHALQQKFNIKDDADKVFADWVRHDHGESRLSDRDLVRAFADENVTTFNFLIENGVEFIEKPITPPDASTVDRIFVTKEWHIPSEVVAPHRNRNGSGLVRRLAESARKKGAQILLKHKMTSIVRESHNRGRVLGIVVQAGDRAINMRALKGVIIATGGHTGNVNFRRMFDPRLTEEYQQACAPYADQNASGEIAAMDIGASLWATGMQTIEAGAAITKTRHIGCRWGYATLVYEPDSIMFPIAKATGLTVKDWQNLIMVNQFGQRFWNEADGSFKFFNAAMAWHGDKAKLNGGGPIWAIFDQAAAEREKWKTVPPHVDHDGFFFQADTLAELAGKIKNPHQKQPMPGAALADTVARYNGFVADGVDKDFKKPTPMHKIEKPPFFAAWSTPILHDTNTGLRTNTDCQVIDTRGEVIAGLYSAGETQGGFAQHGLGRCLVFGRIAGRHAAKSAV